MPAPRRVLACMSTVEYGYFVDPAVDRWDSSIELIRTDSAVGPDALLENLRKSEAPVLLTSWSTPMTPGDIAQRAPTLKYLCHTCGTLRKIVAREAIEKGLLVSNWGRSISRSVAEHTLTLMLGCLRNLAEAQHNMHVLKTWGKPATVRGLFERRVGMHGFGNVARELVKLLAPFDCKLSAFSPYEPDEAFSSLNVKRCATVEELYSSNDVIACVAPLTDETRGCVTEKLLRLLPPDAVFVNTGRGAVNERDLSTVARDGRLQIGIDVYEMEPLPGDSPLRGLKNALLTAHCAGPTQDRRVDCGRFAFQNIGNFFAGRPVEAVIDAVKYDLQT
jgi:phosphoglycerate dehydrogenase-like enzyme